MSNQPVAKYCSVCGNGLVAQAVICPGCGSPARPNANVGSYGDRSKAAAIIFAIFFGPFTWTYTWKTDYWKFWTFCLISLAPMYIGLVSILQLNWISLWASIAILSLMNLWPILDSVVKPSDYYASYLAVSEIYTQQRRLRSLANKGSLILVIGYSIGGIGFIQIIAGVFRPLPTDAVIVAVVWVLVGLSLILIGLRRREFARRIELRDSESIE